MNALNSNQLKTIVIGSLISLLAHPFLRAYMDHVQTDIDEVEKSAKTPKEERNIKKLGAFPARIGILERIAYVSALTINQYGFIALWLGIRTTGGVLPSWNTKFKHIGHARFLKFQLGLLLSLIAAVIAYQIALRITH